MTLAVTEEERMIADAAERLFAERAPVGRLRRYRDSGDEKRFDPALWDTMSALGFAGAELDLAQRCVLSEAAGAVLASEPLATTFFALDLLPGHLSPSGVTVAWDEAGRTNVRRAGEGLVVRGQKRQVEHAGTSTHFVVTAAIDGRSCVALVARGERVVVDVTNRVDLHPAGCVRFEDAPAELLGGADFERALDRATIVHCAGMLGAAQRAFELTLDYLKTRQQFGVPIGSFQALQHRAARLYVELALTRSAVARAARADDPDLPVLASVAKIRCGDTFQRVTEEAIQMHGGIGMTDEHDIVLYLKRAMVAEHTYGNRDFHRRRFATLSGF